MEQELLQQIANNTEAIRGLLLLSCILLGGISGILFAKR